VRVVATAGHVDHGKSTLVRALTGTDPDRFPEEKARGLTIDLGFAFTELDDAGVVGFVDVPGHVRFAKNMLAGVGSVELALLVVDAREGWMPQTAEHVQVLELLGVGQGCVALTKADLVDAATVELARMELDEYLGSTPLASWPVVVCDAVTGRGLSELRAALTAMCRDAPPPLDLHAPRVWVDRSFSVRGVGTVVTGTLTLGALAVDDHVLVEPGARPARIRGIESHHERLDVAPPDTRVALNLTGVDHHTIARGHAVVRPDTFVAASVVDVELLPLATTDLADRSALHAHVGSGEWAARWRRFVSTDDRDDREFGRLRLAAALPLQPGDRLVLRSTARRAVVAGAVVADVAPARRSAGALTRLTSSNDSLARAAAHGRVTTTTELARLGALDRADPNPAIDAAVASGMLEPLGGAYAAPAVIDALAGGAARAVATEARNSPDRDGVELGALATRLGQSATVVADVIAARPAVDLEVARGQVRRRSEPALATASTPDGARLLAALRASPFVPPSPESLGIAPKVAKLLVRDGDAVELDGVVFAADAIVEAERIIGAAVVEQGSLTISEVRDLLGSTRKFVLPIAKRLDADGITRRRGDDRIPGPRAR
jgi:selenocysteine-specific elongation factor